MVLSLQEARQPLPDIAIQTLKKQYEAELPNPSSEAILNYASGLIRSQWQGDKELGIQLLHELLLKAPALRYDVKYLLALGYFNLSQYSESKALADELLTSPSSTFPHKKHVETLMEAIDTQVKKEGLIGLGLVGGAAVAVGALAIGVASLFKGQTKKLRKELENTFSNVNTKIVIQQNDKLLG